MQAAESATDTNDQSEKAPTDTRPPLGDAGRPIRVLNFAGGGFDTIMQLGVTHALLVIQGRAPDAVVGVSAGAIQAAALAEIFQASDEPNPNDISPSQAPGTDEKPTNHTEDDKAEEIAWYQRRISARVTRFQEFVNACHRAPQELLDAVLPDAYQIDSHDPLQPLRVPRFALRERDKRQQDLVARSGLVRLYNDLLGFNLSVGTIARMIRRILGLRAAAEIPSWSGRLFIRLLELFRFWLLLMTDLFRVIPVMPVLLRPLYPAIIRARATTAGDLIFRFKSWRFMVSTLRNSITYIVMCTMTVAVSVLLIAVPALPAYGVLYKHPDLNTAQQIIVVVAFYLIPLIFGATRTLSQHDRATRPSAFWNITKALLHFVWSLVILSASLFPVVVVVGYLFWYSEGDTKLIDTLQNAALTLLVFSGAVIVLIIVWGMVCYLSYRLITGTEQHFSKTLGSWYLNRLLQSYDLSKSLFHPHGLEFFLAGLFDPKHFYGELDLDEAIENSLRDKVNASGRGGEESVARKRKRIAYYGAKERYSPIKVGIAVADVSTGKLDVVPEQESIVSSLLAATAIVPFLPASKIGNRLYIDGSNIANIPTRALLSLLNNHNVNKDSPEIHVYGISPLPFSQPELGQEPGENNSAKEPFLDLIDIALRALKLRQYRDAGLEHRLTQAYTNVIPAVNSDTEHTSAKIVVPDKNNQATKEYFRMWVTPVELEEPVALNKRIMFATKSKRREEILRTIADGCRAAMQTFLYETIHKACGDAQTTRRRLEIENELKGSDKPINCVSCKEVVERHLQQFESVQHLVDLPLPGSYPRTKQHKENNQVREHIEKAHDGGPPGPGIWEICQYCSIRKHHCMSSDGEHRRMLKQHDKAPFATSWPHERVDDKLCIVTKVRREPVPAVRKAEFQALQGKWPKSHVNSRPAQNDYKAQSHKNSPQETPKPLERPLINLLFSGGVFRGVFQIGVLNALHELNVRPDVVAGASVGSITAAIVAHILGVETQSEKQRLLIARLAATYLAVDQIILTDRFADFIRELTIRAAATRFSLRQADHLLRTYDKPWTPAFDHGARQVIAGLERLFYINPYQLNQLVRAIRTRRKKTASRIGRHLVQQWLDRMGVGEQVLGAEPLMELIHHFILMEGQPDGSLSAVNRDSIDACIKQFTQAGVAFLATCTDLSNGKLVTIGDPFSTVHYQPQATRISEALLSSSAFPGVFRSRWSNEIFPGSFETFQYIDGGVMDNFPIAPMVDFLEKASGTTTIPGLISRRPQVPHLVVAASLEVTAPQMTKHVTLKSLEDYWPALSKRAKQLGYNTKLDIYQGVARQIREIYQYITDNPHQSESTTNKNQPLEDEPPLDLEIVAIKPNWLCGTFAFHPMLGYRRHLQAESIAHGCASTLLQFRLMNETWLKGWNIKIDRLPQAIDFADAANRWKRWRSYAREGACWLNYGHQCPFSEEALRSLNEKVEKCELKLRDKTIVELAKIHRACCNLKTHIRDK